jgi:predicted Zn-dependent peptidase
VLLSGSVAARAATKVERVVFENGLTLLYQQDKASAATSVQVFIRGGKAAAPDGKAGLAYLTTRLALEITDEGKAQEVMAQATRMASNALEDFTLISLECLSENLEDALKTAGRIILDPLFSGIRIDRIRDFMTNQGRLEQDEATQAGYLEILKGFYGGTGYGAPVYGTPETLKAIEKKDIQGFYERSMRSGNMVFSVVSDVDRPTIEGHVQKYFAKLKPGQSEPVAPPEPKAPEPREVRLEKDTKQSYVALAYSLPALSPRTYVMALALENLAGKGPGSRLWPLRAEKNLAYNVNCSATLMRGGGVIEAFLEADKTKTDAALEGLKAVMGELAQNGVDQSELQATKTILRANVLRANEMKSPRARTVGRLEMLGLGAEYFEAFFTDLESLTLDEFNAYIKSVLDPSRSLTVVIGPKS